MGTPGGAGSAGLRVFGGTTTRAMEFLNGTSIVGRIIINASTVTYSTSSDYRLKKDIVDMNTSEAMNKIMSLKPRNFTWIETDEETNGFIAHELQEFFPEAVTGEKDKIVEMGNILENDHIILENTYKPVELQENHT